MIAEETKGPMNADVLPTCMVLVHQPRGGGGERTTEKSAKNKNLDPKGTVKLEPKIFE